MRSKFQSVQPGQPQVPTDAFLPQNQYFHTNSWKRGLDVSDAPEDSEAGQSFDMNDVEVTDDDRLIRAPGVTLTDALAHTPSQIFLHAGFQYASDMILLAPPFVGVKNASGVQWFDAGLQSAAPYGYTNFAGVLLLTNGSKGIYARQPNKLALELIDKSVAGFSLAVFADRVVVGGAQLDGKLDFMGVAWSDSTSDYKGWDIALGAGGQSLIGTSPYADRIQGFAALGFDTLVVLNRRSIWIGVPTGDEFQPIRFAERIKGVGCSHAATIQSTELGVIFLADDGVRMFTGSDTPVISFGINRLLGPINDIDVWTSSFDPFRKRYYLHGPTGTWVYDLKQSRWFKWGSLFDGSIFFPTQKTQITWGQALGTWGSQTLAWWQLLPQESGGQMFFLQDANLGVETAASFQVFGVDLQPRWFDRVQVAENQDVLMTALGVRLTHENDEQVQLEVWLPDKPDGNYELVTTAYLAPRTGFTKPAWIPLIHTGRSIGLGFKILAGSPRIRRAAVEFQPTAMPWPIEDTLTQGGGGQVAVPNSAILAPRPVWSNGYETEGQVLRVGQNPATPPPGVVSLLGESTGGFTFVADGGRDNGGHVETVASGDVAEGNYMWLPLGLASDTVPLTAGEAVSPAKGHHHAWNLKGQVLPQAINIMGWGTNTGSGRFFPFVVLQIGVDRFVRAMKVSAGPVLVQIGVTSTFQVPADGWFSIEGQAWAGPSGSPIAGFCIARYYAADQAPEGVDLTRALGVDLEGGGVYGVAWGSEVVRGASGGVSGIGIDDSVVYNNSGTARRWLGDCRVGAAVPSGVGDETNSEIGYDSTHGVGTPPQTIGAVTSHGSGDRWRNVTGTPVRPANEQTAGDWWFGQTSIFTDAWLYGPLPYNVPNPDVSPLYNSPAAGAIGAIPRNTFYDAAGDLYRVNVGRSNIADVEGIMAYARSSMSWVQGRLGTGPEARDGGGLAELEGEAPGEEFAVVSRHRDEGIDQSRQANFRPRIKSGGVEASLPVVSATRASFGLIPIAEAWQTILGYSVAPYSFLDRDPSTAAKFAPSALQSVQVGAVGDFTAFDAINPGATPDQRWIQFDLVELGFDYVYHPTVVSWGAPIPQPPRAGFLFAAATNLPARHIVIQDASVDWDGTVTSRMVDWGDGSALEPIAAGGQLTHDYAVPGTYTITLTATDNAGLTGTVSHDAAAFVVNQAPVADFSVAADPGDLTGQTADFTDLSTDDGVVSGWDWDFGDGSPHSALQNPTHVYAAPGTYTVTLVVTDNGGEAGQPPLTDSFSADVTVPFAVGGARVNMPIVFADSMHAGGKQSTQRAGVFFGVATVVAGAGRDGRDCIEEGDTGTVWEYGIAESEPRVFQFCFDLNGQALPAWEVPLMSVANSIVVPVLRPDGKVRVYVQNGSGVMVQAFETAAAMPASGWVHGVLRVGNGDATSGYVTLRINGETLTADPIDVVGGFFTSMHGQDVFLGTGLGTEIFPAWPGFVHGIAGVRWCDIAMFDDAAFAASHDAHPGDVHFSISTPQGAGSLNDVGGVATDVQTDDQATTELTFTAVGQQKSFTVSTPTGTFATILAVLPYYQGFRGGSAGGRTHAVLLKSGATTVQSGSINGSSSWTARFHVTSLDPMDAWVLLTDPATAAAWADAAAIGATEVGIVVLTLVAGGTILISQLGLEVAYWDV